ncbi:Uncharacterised protein [Collinsella intestinalis]|nr:Uncharacterised protein [Collinsella intestinalis]
MFAGELPAFEIGEQPVTGIGTGIGLRGDRRPLNRVLHRLVVVRDLLVGNLVIAGRSRRGSTCGLLSIGRRLSALALLLATTRGLLALLHLSEHLAGARADRIDIQTESIGDLHVIAIDHVARTQRIDELEGRTHRLGAAARCGDIAFLLEFAKDEIHERNGIVEQLA